MSKGYSRCEFMSPESNLQCEIWFETPERKKKENGDLLPILCPDHEKGLVLENGKAQYIETVNIQREYCSSMDLDSLEAHIAKIESEIENQKVLLYTARAVKADKLQGLSEEERQERLKYKVQKTSKSESSQQARTTLKSNPLAHLQKHGLSESKAKDLLTMDVNELIKKYSAKKDEKK